MPVLYSMFICTPNCYNIFCTILYNSYNIVTPYQFVQPVQPVQLHLQILYKRFDQRLYNLSEKVLKELYNLLCNISLSIYQTLYNNVVKVLINLL